MLTFSPTTHNSMSFFFFTNSFSARTPLPVGVSTPFGRQSRRPCGRFFLASYSANLMRSCARLRLERFVFDQTKFRTYVFFKNVLTLSIFRFRSWLLTERTVVHALSKRSNRSFMSGEAFGLVLVRAIGFMFTLVGGLFFFIRLMTGALQRLRRQWAIASYMMTLLDSVRMGFWYHTHLQYRIAISGRLGGVMRASKRFIGHGALKLYLWRGVLDYVQTDVRTQWGVFGFSFWLQFRDVPQLRVVRFIQRYRKILRSLIAAARVDVADATLSAQSVTPYSRFTDSHVRFGYENCANARSSSSYTERPLVAAWVDSRTPTRLGSPVFRRFTLPAQQTQGLVHRPQLTPTSAAKSFSYRWPLQRSLARRRFISPFRSLIQKPLAPTKRPGRRKLKRSLLALSSPRRRYLRRWAR